MIKNRCWPQKLLAEGMFLLWGDLSRGEPWSLQGFFQPLGQQSGTVSVQTQQNLREILGQTARWRTANHLRRQRWWRDRKSQKWRKESHSGGSFSLMSAHLEDGLCQELPLRVQHFGQRGRVFAPRQQLCLPAKIMKVVLRGLRIKSKTES